MDGVIENFEKTCIAAIELAKTVNVPNFYFDKIAICGVGGSGVVGDLLKDVVKNNSQFQIDVIKDYHLPKHVNSRTLVFCISHSGNTEETLNQFVEAREIGCNIISITSGGKLKEWSQKVGSTFIEVPGGMQPRDAVPYMLISLISCLQKLGVVGDFSKDFSEIPNAVKSVGLNLLDQIATKIKSSDVSIYGSSEFSGIIRRFKNDFNENAKMLVKYDFFPELNHNEINGYQRADLLKNADVIFLRDKDEKDEIRVRFDITKDFLKYYVNSIHEIWSVGNSQLAKIISFVYMSSYLTAKIAELVSINRERVIFVEKLKEGLKQRLNLVEKLEERLFRPRSF